MEKCGYCGKRMCGSFSGSTLCEPDGYRSQYSSEELAALLDDWNHLPSGALVVHGELDHTPTRFGIFLKTEEAEACAAQVAGVAGKCPCTDCGGKVWGDPHRYGVWAQVAEGVPAVHAPEESCIYCKTPKSMGQFHAGCGVCGAIYAYPSQMKETPSAASGQCPEVPCGHCELCSYGQI